MKVCWCTEGVLVGQHRGMDWSVGGQLVARYTRQTLLVVSYSSTQPTVDGVVT